MAKIPDRFLGFSFSVGDVLIELDRNYNIINADGTLSEIGLFVNQIGKTNFLDYVSGEERETFKNISASLNNANRVGPISFMIGPPKSTRKRLLLFINKLPGDNNRIFIVLVLPYRLGASEITTSKKDSFLEKAENILNQNRDLNKKLNITLMETAKGANLDPEQADKLENLLNKYSTGGNSAGQVGDNQYAVIHEKEPDGLATEDLIRELTKATGIELNSTTIDVDDKSIREEDGVRALIFSLQQFSENAAGFDVQSLAQGYNDIVVGTAQKVKKLRKILEEGTFSLVFQPIINLKTNEVHHSEALIRFNDPEMLDLQFETICFAEKVGLIQDFDTAIFNRVVEKLDHVMDHENAPNIAVNMSGRSLSNKGFLDNLKKRLKKYIHLKNYISLEITESSEIKDLQQLSIVIDEVRSMGFKVYLDDFGAGAAGFRYLKELNVDGVKIDGDYVRDALTDKKTRAFLRSITLLCNDLDIETIAEWVETEDQSKLLKALGVTYAQGYLYGRPNSGIKTSIN